MLTKILCVLKFNNLSNTLQQLGRFNDYLLKEKHVCALWASVSETLDFKHTADTPYVTIES